MCGLIGFFVGCDFALACPKRLQQACPKQPRSAFGAWDEKASVRSRPYRIAAEDETALSERHVPVLRHRLLAGLAPEARMALRRMAFQRFMNFTHKLELVVVNTVTANIALENYGFRLPETLVLDAHRIYVDEAYHALVAYNAMAEAAKRLEGQAVQQDRPPFLSYFLSIEADGKDRRAALLQVFFVIVSEMLITTTLKDAHRHHDMGSTVGALLHDHAVDESRHHAFYKSFLDVVWEQLSDPDQGIVLDAIPEMIRAYCRPDLSTMARELESVGIGRAATRSILAETYAEPAIAEFAIGTSRSLVAILFALVNSSQADRLQHALQRQGLLEMERVA